MKDTLSLYSQNTPFKEFGIYIHIPYCLQKCHYCDFVKFKVDELPPYEDYFNLLFQELEQKKIPTDHKLKTIYFGGGTPSLAPQALLEKTLQLIFKIYTKVESSLEVTLEINPGTLQKKDLQNLLSMGFNRFSLGLQSFKDQFLQSCGRNHSGKDSQKDIEEFASLGLNYSVDLLFGLPHQSLQHLEDDLEILCQFQPPHVSPYNLTLPPQHFFNKNRASDETQAKMMDLIKDKLSEVGVRQYEVSNFSQPGKESQHNLIYWTDQNYWGLGMGAHSYIKENSSWGTRFWNPGNFTAYSHCATGTSRPKDEVLQAHEALTDFCHTSLRSIIGLSRHKLENKFTDVLPHALWNTLEKLERQELLSYKNSTWRLTKKGFKMPNQVFNELCFLQEDL